MTPVVELVIEYQNLIHKPSSSSGGTLYTLALTVAFDYHGEVVRVHIQPYAAATNSQTLLNRWTGRYPMGAELTVWYNPDDREDAGLDPPGASKWGSFFQALHFLAFIAFGFGLFGLWTLLT